MSLAVLMLGGALLLALLGLTLVAAEKGQMKTRAIQIGGAFVVTLLLLLYIAYRVLRAIHRHP